MLLRHDEKIDLTKDSWVTNAAWFLGPNLES